MAGFDYAAGRSNNMVEAESRGMVTIGRWARRFKVSAAAAVAVMRPTEAHHTGTGRRGKSRLTPVIDAATEPTAEQLAAMRAFDAGDRPQVSGVYLKWAAVYDGPYGRKRFIPTVAVFEGDEAASRKLKEFESLTPAEMALARAWAGKDIREFRAALKAARQN
jgi:hypothetical protein